MMLKREASHLDIDDILPDQFEFRAMADYIDGTKEDTIFLLIEILVVESSGLRS
jgi:hypothetical protein